MSVSKSACGNRCLSWLPSIFASRWEAVLLLLSLGLLLPTSTAWAQPREQQIQDLLAQYPTRLRYEPNSDKLFLLGIGQHNWGTSEERARNSHSFNGVPGRLATIRSQEENDVVWELLLSRSVGSAWLGGKDAGHEGNWRWHADGVDSGTFRRDGRNVAYSNWRSHQPDNYRGREHGLEMNVGAPHNGAWNDQDRGRALDYVVEFDAAEVFGPVVRPGLPLEQRQQIIQQIVADNPGLHYVPEADKFYKLVIEDLTWDKAEAKARTAHPLLGVQAQLATAPSQAEYRALTQVLAGRRAWLGASDKDREGIWQWYQDGKAAGPSFSTFAVGSPNNYQGIEHFLEMRPDGSLNDNDVTDQFSLIDSYIVEWKGEELLGPAPAPPAPLPMPPTLRQQAIDDLLARQDARYFRYVPGGDKFMMAVSGDYTWREALLAAGDPARYSLQGVVGQLVTIRSQEENDAVQQLAQSMNRIVWIGASDRDEEGAFRWHDRGVAEEEPFYQNRTTAPGAFSAFRSSTGEPNNYGGNEDYVELNLDGSWNDNNTTDRSFVIEWNAVDLLGPKAPEALDKLEVPLPNDLDKFVKDRHKATVLGKALFWDMQVGSDGRTACATCHFASGIDFRTRNVVNPGAPGSAFGPQNDESRSLLQEALAQFEGSNEVFDAAEFPHAKLEHPTRSIFSNTLVEDSKEVYGSQGVVKKDFLRIVEGAPVDEGQLVPDPVFNINGANARQVTGRNSPTTINAVFHDRLFWDGRANHFFNGVNEFGDLDANAKVLKKIIETQTNTVWRWVWKVPFSWAPWYGYWSWEPVTTTSTVEKLEPTRILLNNAALASQAVGPPLSDVEMSWHGRNFKQLGRKMLSLRPLAVQMVNPEDSVLGQYAATPAGLQSGIDYASLIRDAFHDEWWSSTKVSPNGYTQMEENFSLYWGLSLLMYQSTLVSDQSPFDQWSNGDVSAMSENALKGLSLFMDHCASCHEGSEFAGATVSDIRGTPDLVEFMVMGDGNNAHYDNGFYNIGVRPTNEDIGVGAAHPIFGPLSYSRQREGGRDIGQDINVSGRIAVDGAFKTNTVRNAELTGPFFHTGGYRTLREVVEFYTRGGTFFRENIADIDPDMDGISELQEDPEKIDFVVEFMRHLTDERVRRNQAPFDHPQLFVPNGHNGVDGNIATDDIIEIPAVGRNGGAALESFEERVQ